MAYRVPPEVITEFVESNFTDIKWFTASNEAKVISPFHGDGDGSRWMSINLGSGLWRVFGSDQKKGNIFSLYAKMSGKSYGQALQYFALKAFDTLDLDYLTKKKKQTPFLTKTNIPEDWEEVSLDKKEHMAAAAYMWKRHIVNLSETPIYNQRFFVSESPKYKDRLIIPIIHDGKLIFYLSRDLTGTGFRYVNCDSDTYTRTDWIVYPYDTEAEQVLICEGIFDAMALQCIGVNATCVFGDSISDVQMDLLRSSNCKLVAAFDNDKAGEKATKRFDSKLKSVSIDDLYICTPPDPYKDWNAFICETNKKEVLSYIENNTPLYDFFYITLSSLSN